MLQWMGGSRRKVTTSRKSTQKRQKQYFEQRKRQQQQQDIAFTENNVDNLVDHPKRNRSLDILSLLNISKVAEEFKPLRGVENTSNLTNKGSHASCVEDVDSSLMKKSKGHTDSASDHTSTSAPIKPIDQFKATDFTVPAEKRGSSSHQMGRVSSQSYRGNFSNGKNMESDYLKNASSIQPSIFDIIGDDEGIEISEEERAQEAHVAFSVEGLGTVGTETPMQSPQRPRSQLNGKQSSFTKAAKNPNSVNNFNALPDGLAMEVECLMHDVKKPSRRIDLSGDELYPFTSFEHDMSTFKDDMRLDGKQCRMNSLYREDRHDNFFDAASSSCFDDYDVDEKFGVNLKKCDDTNSSYFGRNDSLDEKFGVNLKKCDGTDNSYFGRNDSSNFKFERFHSPMRHQEEIPDKYNYLDEDCRFTTFNEPKYSSFVCNYQPQDYSPFVKVEDMPDNLTSFSGESCSSTAVGGESTADVSYARHRRKYGKDLEVPLDMSAKVGNGCGIWNRTSSTPRQGDKCLSRKHIGSGSSRSKSAVLSEAALFEEEFPLPKINLHPVSSFFTSFEKTQHQREDLFGLDGEADRHKSKYFFDMSQKDVSNEFSSENFGFHQPFCSRKPCRSSFVSKATFEENSLGVRDFELHVQSDVFGDNESNIPAAELSAQGSVTEEAGDQSKSRPPCSEKYNQIPAEKKYSTPESSLPTRETTLRDYGGSCNVTNNCDSQEVSGHDLEEDAEETLFNNFTRDSDNELNIVPKGLQGGQSLAGEGAAAENLKGTEPKTTLMDPCYRLMTVEMYVIKLQCARGKAAVWNAMNLF